MSTLRRYNCWFALVLIMAVPLVRTAVSGEKDRDPFPHEIHVEEQEIACESCHQESDRPEEKTLPVSPESCADCHETSDVSRFFPVGAYHSPDWLHAHQFQTRITGDRCTTCHEGSESCTNCHDGENLDLQAHPRNYMYLHAMDARHGVNDCTACHQTSEFCLECHIDEGIRPGNHDVPGWRRGSGHGVEARRDVGYCAACHDQVQPVCLDCH